MKLKFFFLKTGVILFLFSLILSCSFGGDDGPADNDDDNQTAETLITVDDFFWGTWVYGDKEWKIYDAYVDRPALADSEFKQADENGFELWNTRVSRISQNVIKATGNPDFYLFRVSGADAKMSLDVKEIIGAGPSVSRDISGQVAGLGDISVIIQNLENSSDKHELTSNSDGTVTVEDAITGDNYQITLEGDNLPGSISTVMTPLFDGEDLGDVTVNNPDKTIKVSYSLRGLSYKEYFMYAEPRGADEDYEIILSFKNFGTEEVTNFSYEISPPSELNMTGMLTGTLDSISPGGEDGDPIILGVRAKPISDYMQSFIIPVNMSDDDGNQWADSINIRFFRDSAAIDLDSVYSDCRGVVISPEGQAASLRDSFFDDGINVPVRREPYRLVVSCTDHYTGEEWYSLSIDNDTPIIARMYLEDSFPEYDINEPNDSEYETGSLFYGEVVTGHIEPGDLDIFTAYVTPVDLQIIFEPSGGTYFSSPSVSLTNQAGGEIHWNDEERIPVETDPSYSPVPMYSSGVIKASVFGGELPEEIVFTEYYELKVPAPLITPDTEGYLVSLNPYGPDSGITLGYTLDGSEPDNFSSVCGPGAVIVPGSGEVLKVRAFKEGWTGSFTSASEYSIGDPGPAGGFIFEDKGEYTDGWRYKEVRKEVLDVQYSWEEAVTACSGLNTSGFNGWILPSTDELRAVREHIYETDLMDSTGICWSSSVYSSTSSYAFYMSTGSFYSDDNYEEHYVMPVRYF